MKKLLFILALLSGSAFADKAILNTFNSGELSPHLDARLDFEKYVSGCRTLENFIVLPYGGALKRPGTQYIADTKSNGVVRLAPFSVGVDQTYVMELGHDYIRFYSDGVQLVDTSSVPLEVVTPYTSNEVFEVQMAQFADTVYIVHPDHPPYKLQRTTTAPTFTMTQVTFDWPATLDENLTDTTISSSATTGSVTLTSSASLFSTNHVGSDWVLRSPRDVAKTTLDLSNADGTSDVLRVEGDWNLRTIGIWDGELTLQISEDDGTTWGDYREYQSQNDPSDPRNYDRSGTESEAGVKYRMLFDWDDDAGSAGTATLLNEEPYLNGWVAITNYLSVTQVQAVVSSTLGSTNVTEIWYEGAFSEERGYPRTVEFYENRLFFGGTEYLANTLWASMTDDYENFKTGTYDDSGLKLSINSDNIIEWLLGRTQLFIGTLGDEWILSGGDSATPLTPTSVLARRQTSFGSRDGVDALLASDSIVYLQRQGRKIRQFEYSLETDSYKSLDTTILAEHITKGGVIQIEEQQQPEPIIWCVRGDGQLVGLTYSKEQNVFGWHRHITDGEFESIAVIPTDGEDRVYVVVNRDNGRYIEWFRPFDWGNDDDAWFVDSGLDFDGGDAVDVDAVNVAISGVVTVSADNSFTNGYDIEFSDVTGMVELEDFTFEVADWTTTNFTLKLSGSTNYADGLLWTDYTGTGTVQRVENTFTNVSHLAGQDVSVFADGGAQPDETITTNGVLVIDDYKNRVIAGLPYTARLSPMYIDVVGQEGISYAKVKTPYKVHFRVLNSGTFNYGSTTNSLFPVSVRLPSLSAGQPVPFFSGDPTTKSVNSTPSTAPEFWVTSDAPLPLELLSLTIFTDIQEME